MQGQYQYRQKCILKNLQFLAVTYDMVVLSLSFRRCLNGIVFSFVNQFLETEMTWSQPIIERECLFKNQNWCFVLRKRVKAEYTKFNVD